MLFISQNEAAHPATELAWYSKMTRRSTIKDRLVIRDTTDKMSLETNDRDHC